MNYITNESANLATNFIRSPRVINKVATERGIYAASACDTPAISFHSRRSNLRPLKRHKCRAPSRFARHFVTGPVLGRTWMALAVLWVLLAFPALVRPADAVTNLDGLIPFYTTNRLAITNVPVLPPDPPPPPPPPAPPPPPPPAGDGSDWTPQAGSIKVKAHASIWFSFLNKYYQNRIKHLHIVIEAVGNKNDIINLDSQGHQAGFDDAGKPVKSKSTDYGLGNGKKYGWYTFDPQPAWERLEFKNNNNHDIEIVVKASTTCVEVQRNANYLFVPECEFGAVGTGIMLTNQHIREVTLFPKMVPVDLTTLPPFSAPAQTGNWTASPASIDPDGMTHAVTGVRFVTDGAGLQPGDVASFSFAMQGPSADLQYTMYAFDATTTQFQEYHLDFRPTLSMSGSAGTVQLSWPVTETRFTLERTVDLATPRWLPVPQAPSIADGQFVVTESTSGAMGFYRLRENVDAATTARDGIVTLSPIPTGMIAPGNSYILPLLDPQNSLNPFGHVQLHFLSTPELGGRPANYFMDFGGLVVQSGGVELNMAEDDPNARDLGWNRLAAAFTAQNPSLPGQVYLVGLDSTRNSIGQSIVNIIPGQGTTYQGTLSAPANQSFASVRIITSVPIRIGIQQIGGTFSQLAVDTTPPSLSSATAACLDDRITLSFSEPIDAATAANPLNYFLGDGAQVWSASMIDPQTVQLFTSDTFQPGLHYSLMVNGIRDLAGNFLLPGATIQFGCSGQ